MEPQRTACDTTAGRKGPLATGIEPEATIHASAPPPFIDRSVSHRTEIVQVELTSVNQRLEVSSKVGKRGELRAVSRRAKSGTTSRSIPTSPVEAGMNEINSNPTELASVDAGFCTTPPRVNSNQTKPRKRHENEYKVSPRLGTPGRGVGGEGPRWTCRLPRQKAGRNSGFQGLVVRSGEVGLEKISVGCQLKTAQNFPQFWPLQIFSNFLNLFTTNS